MAVTASRIRFSRNALSLLEVHLGALATDAAGQLDVLALGHDGHTLGVARAQVGVLEEASLALSQDFFSSPLELYFYLVLFSRPAPENVLIFFSHIYIYLEPFSQLYI